MKKNPFVSVLMPNYNCEKFITEAIESILNQTYQDFEFLIIDDCSTDKSYDIIKKYAKKDSRIKHYKNAKNLGIISTRNKLFDLASQQTKYYAIMDSDDICTKNRLNIQVTFLEENSSIGVVGSNIIIIDEQSQKIGYRQYHKTISSKNILLKNPIAQPSTMLRKEVIEKIGGYTFNKEFNKGVDADFILWIRAYKFYQIANIKDFLLKYRISSRQSKNTHLKETIKSTLFTQKKYFGTYGNLKVLAMMVSEYILLLLPNSFILWLFYKIEFKN